METTLTEDEAAHLDDLLEALASGNMLEKFDGLAEADRAHLARWVLAARDDETRWRRTSTLVVAMRISRLTVSG